VRGLAHRLDRLMGIYGLRMKFRSLSKCIASVDRAQLLQHPQNISQNWRP
jgi:hypothetical protein